VRLTGTTPPTVDKDTYQYSGDEMSEKRKRVETDGSAAKLDKTEQLKRRRQNRGNGAVADWGSVDGGKLTAAVAAVTQHGMAIMFGYTKDGSAYTIRYIGDDAPAPEYVRPSEDIDLHLDGIAMDFEK
jgi:hypothetical protein